MKKAILAVSFGTSHIEQINRCIASIVIRIKETFPDTTVDLAFSSQMIIDKLAREHQIIVPSISQKLEAFKAAGYDEVIIQPLHMISGKEYTKVLECAQNYAQCYSIKIGKPLLNSNKDFAAITKNLDERYGREDALLVLLGHGTTHYADEAYAKLEREIQSQGVIAVVSTLERFDSALELIDIAKAYQKKTLCIIPLMLVSGNHMQYDILGMGESQWQGKLSQSEIEIKIIQQGLGESVWIHELFIEHVKEAKKLGDI